MSYKFPKMTVEGLNELPKAQRDEVLRIVLKGFNLANEKLGFRVTPEAVYLNEPAQAPNDIQEIRTVAEADELLNRLVNSTLAPAPISEQPIAPAPVQETQAAPTQSRVACAGHSCRELILERLSQSSTNIHGLKDFIKARITVADNSIRDSLWRLVRDGVVVKVSGASRSPDYRLANARAA